MKNLSFSRNKQQGFTLVELLLVLGVLALIAITAFIIYPSVQAGTQANTESANITTITASVKNLFGSSGNYSGLTGMGVTGQCSAYLFPSDMLGGVQPPAGCTTFTNAVNVWGNPVTLNPYGTNNQEFEIAYDVTGAPQACEKFVADVAANYDTVGSTPGGSDIKQSGGAVLPGGIVTACTSTTTPVKIYFYSK